MRTWDAEALWQVFDHMGIDPSTMTLRPLQGPPRPDHAPIPEATPWSIEKASNRLRRSIEKVEAGKWRPKLPYRWNGAAERAYREAQEAVGEAGEVLKEVQR